MYSLSKIPSLIAISCLLSCSQLFGQEQLGLRLDNYSGANAITLNPAANATCAFGWDVNLIGFGIGGSNNMAYIENASVGKTIRNAAKIGPDPALNIFFKGTPALEYNFTDKPKSFGSMVIRVMGPSFVVNLGSGHSFGLFSSVRAVLSSNSLPRVLNPYEMQRTVYGKSFDIDPFKIKGLIWGEWGINYAYKIGGDTEGGGLAMGVNLKFMKGFQGFFIDNLEGTKMTRLSKDTFRFDAMNGNIGFTTNYDDKPTQSNGSGFGLDIGAILTTAADDNRPYEWRFGASILDLGSIKINRNTEVHQFLTKEGFVLSKQNFEGLNAQDPRADALQRINQIAFKNPQATLKSNSMVFGLPTALQLQADFAVTKNIFINGLVIQRIQISDKILERDNLIALTPRYESHWLGASMPISVFNYKQVRVGLAARLAFLTIGTEHLMSFMSNSNLYGTDFYMALKINPFKVGSLSLGNKGGSGGSWGKNKRVSCYKF